MLEEIVIVGAGASGLMAARRLSNAGKRVRILEGRSQAGGRIRTLSLSAFSSRIEAGAEFIHGNLPITLGLLKEAKLSYHKIEGELWNARDGKPHQQEDFIEDQKMLVRKLKELQYDMSVQHFLHEHFNEEKHTGLRASVAAFVQGYELADLDRASTFSLREEWLNGEDEDQFRIDEGYGALISYLQRECEHNGCIFEFNTTVKKIEWKKNEANLITSDSRMFSAQKIVITLPLSILQADSLCRAFIEFQPKVESKIEAARSLGYGELIKFILEFNEPFWENKHVVGKNRLRKLGFVFASTVVPTWWTQAPSKNAILTGWFGGPRVKEWKKMNEEGLIQIAINSLADIFKIDHAVLVEKMVAGCVFNWAMDEFSLGGYSYQSLNREKFLEVLAVPEKNTLYFCGETMEKDPTKLGTVEAALASGLSTAEQILRQDD